MGADKIRVNQREKKRRFHADGRRENPRKSARKEREDSTQMGADKISVNRREKESIRKPTRKKFKGNGCRLPVSCYAN